MIGRLSASRTASTVPYSVVGSSGGSTGTGASSSSSPTGLRLVAEPGPARCRSASPSPPRSTAAPPCRVSRASVSATRRARCGSTGTSSPRPTPSTCCSVTPPPPAWCRARPRARPAPPGSRPVCPRGRRRACGRPPGAPGERLGLRRGERAVDVTEHHDLVDVVHRRPGGSPPCAACRPRRPRRGARPRPTGRAPTPRSRPRRPRARYTLVRGGSGRTTWGGRAARLAERHLVGERVQRARRQVVPGLPGDPQGGRQPPPVVPPRARLGGAHRPPPARGRPTPARSSSDGVLVRHDREQPVEHHGLAAGQPAPADRPAQGADRPVRPVCSRPRPVGQLVDVLHAVEQRVQLVGCRPGGVLVRRGVDSGLQLARASLDGGERVARLLPGHRAPPAISAITAS